MQHLVYSLNIVLTDAYFHNFQPYVIRLQVITLFISLPCNMKLFLTDCCDIYSSSSCVFLYLVHSFQTNVVYLNDSLLFLCCCCCHFNCPTRLNYTATINMAKVLLNPFIYISIRAFIYLLILSVLSPVFFFSVCLFIFNKYNYHIFLFCLTLNL